MHTCMQVANGRLWLPIKELSLFNTCDAVRTVTSRVHNNFYITMLVSDNTFFTNTHTHTHIRDGKFVRACVIKASMLSKASHAS